VTRWAVNRFRFSTKAFDDATGFGYWGYRWYSPRLGRWLSRDPIGEGRRAEFVC
jgi:RHS repeat-associated protein